MAGSKCSEWKHVFAMVGVEVAFAIANILLKKVLDEGIDHLALITYRQAIAALSLAPIAFFKERKTRPKLTAGTFILIFICSLLGATLTQYFVLIGLKYTSATFSCAFINVVPVVTFLMALPFGLETASLKNNAGRAKVFGTIFCVGGAMVLTFCKGVAVTNRTHLPATTYASQPLRLSHEGKGRKWAIGSISLLGGCLFWSTWFLLQARISKNYSAPYSTTTIISFLSALQSAALGMVIHRDVSMWALKGKFLILTVIYSGLVGSGLCYVVMAWCVEKRGPVFTAAFSPLIQIIVGIIDFSVLREQLHLGSILGSVIVIAGLYILLWGKSMEAQETAAKQIPTTEEKGEGESAL